MSSPNFNLFITFLQLGKLKFFTKNIQLKTLKFTLKILLLNPLFFPFTPLIPDFSCSHYYIFLITHGVFLLPKKIKFCGFLQHFW